MPQRACLFLCVLLVAGLVSGQEGAVSLQEGAVSLQEGSAEVNHSYAEISRIFARNCLECHGPDASHREAGLRLDDRQSVTERLASGSIAVTPGMPEVSELLRRVTALDDTRMPPAEAGAPLTAAEIAQITEWIRAGAEWDTHWALVAPLDHPPPDVRAGAWASQPLDWFILRRIEDNLQQPLASADRRTLIRRVYFDLIGLPPTPAQVELYQNDESPDAWGKVVDELLATPLYGQRWGRHWLDVARYGDSNGSDENHAYPLAWRYRNYVIDAFNDDLPFDQFLREQLAGDLLPNGTREYERVIATGFLAIGTKILAEKDPGKKQADMVDEQIDTVGRALLGFSVACARCHDHKFDPIPTTDYYALAGILPAVADELCMIHSVCETNVAHGGACMKLHTGDEAQLRPSLGSWVSYGLGTENQNLPSFITICPTSLHGGVNNFGAAALPAVHSGVPLGTPGYPNTKAEEATFDFLQNSRLTAAQQRLQLQLLRQVHAAAHAGGAELDARLQSFELAFRMQTAAPEAIDLSGESKATHELYGLDDPQTENFGRECLLARRFAERGVRFIQVSHAHSLGFNNEQWDQHTYLKKGHTANVGQIDKPITGLLTDLKQRGLLQDTLVVWGGEFGRTPTVQVGQVEPGRDHHPEGFTIWLAGGGVKGGFRYGRTDEYGYYAVENRFTIHDLHATLLHLLGLDHTRLTWPFSGRDLRLTDVYGEVATGILA